MKLFKKSLLLSTILFLQIAAYAQHTKSKWIALVTSINEAYIPSVTGDEKLFRGDDSRIEFTGRVEYGKGKTPKFWAPGVYFTTRFQGDECEIILEDEVLYGTSHNYIELAVDGSAIRLEMVDRYNSIKIANLSNKKHSLLLCKNTESGIGYLQLLGLRCKELMKPDARPSLKIEFIGNSITCGAGSDFSEKPCGSGQWYDQHNAYAGYGSTTARSLHAQWLLSAVSGIGLIHSCCNMKITMPQVWDKVNMREDSIRWDFNQYIPDIVTICLGQNDGIQDSVAFCSAYVQFINKIRSVYPQARIVCLTSPMADGKLTAALKNYLSGIVAYVNSHGDARVSFYFFSKRYYHGCGDHPDLAEHRQIAGELTAYLKKLIR